MIDYRVPKNIGGFNPQKLYTEILKSKSTDRLYVQKHKDKTLIASHGALYVVPGKYPLAEGFIEERKFIEDLIPDWDKGVPCEDTRSEMALTDKTVVKIFRKDYEDIYFDKKYFKYFTDDTFEYRMSDSGNSLYVAYKGDLIATILRINVSK